MAVLEVTWIAKGKRSSYRSRTRFGSSPCLEAGRPSTETKLTQSTNTWEWALTMVLDASPDPLTLPVIGTHRCMTRKVPRNGAEPCAWHCVIRMDDVVAIGLSLLDAGKMGSFAVV